MTAATGATAAAGGGVTGAALAGAPRSVPESTVPPEPARGWSAAAPQLISSGSSPATSTASSFGTESAWRSSSPSRMADCCSRLDRASAKPWMRVRRSCSLVRAASAAAGSSADSGRGSPATSAYQSMRALALSNEGSARKRA